MVRQMADNYVSKDSNSNPNTLSLNDASMLVMDGGVAMSEGAFRGRTPMTTYTLEELGMNPAASPFSRSNPMNDNATPAAPISYDAGVTVDTARLAADEQDRENADANVVVAFNQQIGSMFRQYGFLLIGGLALIGLGWFVGKESGQKKILGQFDEWADEIGYSKKSHE